MDDSDDHLDEWRERSNQSDGQALKEVLEWIETFADKHELPEDDREVAAVLGRRKLRDADDPLPKEVARDAVNEARDEA